jgi:Ca2+-transporting ATPase
VSCLTLLGPYSGTLTRNEQTVIELYTVDEVVSIDPPSGSLYASPSPAMRQTIDIGAICNNASSERRDGKYVGQSTDVALLDLLDVFGIADGRQVRNFLGSFVPEVLMPF